MWHGKAHIILNSPITWGVVTLVFSSIAFSGRLSVTLSNILLFLAFLIGCFGISRVGLGIHLSVILCLLFGIGLTLVSWWIDPGLQKKQPKTEKVSELKTNKIDSMITKSTDSIPQPLFYNYHW